MVYFVFGDTHSNHKAVLNLLKQEGLVDGRGKRIREEVFVVSIGDLANCVIESRDEDLKALDLVGPVINQLLIGNHEAPYFRICEAFAGFFWYPEVKEKLDEIRKANLSRAAISINNSILVTHAGLNISWCNDFASSDDAVKYINEALDYSHRPSAILNRIGMGRGGWGEGGILWRDWSESVCDNFAQICGHSIGSNIRFKIDGKEISWTEELPLQPLTIKPEKSTFCIDVGCNSTGFRPFSNRLAGVWIEKDEPLRFVIANCA